ncbi:hypothetical protein [Lysinibacillus sp. CTST325]
MLFVGWAGLSVASDSFRCSGGAFCHFGDSFRHFVGSIRRLGGSICQVLNIV